MVRFYDPGRAYKVIREEILEAIDDVLTRGDLILRKDLEEFEKTFAEYVGTKYALGVASGTDAILLSLKALKIGKGDEVIIPSYTFRATIEATRHAGASPVLADRGQDWRELRTKKTKAVIPVHMEGDTLDWTPDDLLMVEDACQAVGAKPVTGNTACYSFYPAKILGCYGDGGAIATNDKELYDELYGMRDHYKQDTYSHKSFGYNSRLDNVQAAVLNVKMKYLGEQIARRKQIADIYNESLSEHITLPKLRYLYQDYIINVGGDKEELYEYLKNMGIETMKNGYPFPKEVPKTPKAIEYEQSSLRLPIQPELDDKEIYDVVEAINSFYE